MVALGSALCGACSTVPALVPGAIHCDEVELEVTGIGGSRREALDDARAQAVARELGTYTTSEMVLVNDELAVHRTGDASRGIVKSVKGVGDTRLVGGEIEQRARVTLCRNNVAAPDTSRPPSDDDSMQTRVRAMTDESDGRTNARLTRHRNIEDAIAAVLTPAAGPDIHRSRIVTANPLPYADGNAMLRFRLEAEIGLAPETRRSLGELLDRIAVARRGVGLFGSGYAKALARPGIALFDQRLEHAANPYILHADLVATAGAPIRSSLDGVTDTSVIRGLVEVDPAHATILRDAVTEAIDTFDERGLQVVAWSPLGERIVHVPLAGRAATAFSRSTARIDVVRVYPKRRNGKWNLSNGAVLPGAEPATRSWLGRELSPLQMLSTGTGSRIVPALRLGEAHVVLDLQVPRALGERIVRFTIEPAAPGRGASMPARLR